MTTEFYVKLKAYTPDYMVQFVNSLVYMNSEICWDSETLILFYKDSKKIGMIQLSDTEMSATLYGKELYKLARKLSPFKTMVFYGVD